MAELMKENEVSFYIGDRHIAPYGAGGGSVDITEITSDNVEEAVSAATSILLRSGLDASDDTDQTYYYAFFVKICNGGLVPLPVNYIFKFSNSGIPMLEDQMTYVNSEDSSDYTLFINAESDTVLYDGKTYIKPSTLSEAPNAYLGTAKYVHMFIQDNGGANPYMNINTGSGGYDGNVAVSQKYSNAYYFINS